jgi:hypothetical protein
MADKRHLLTLAKDMRDNGISIQLWPMPSLNHPSTFDRSFFFDELILGERHEHMPLLRTTHCFTSVNDMLGDINLHADIPRKIQTVPFFLPDWENHMGDPCIMLDLYQLVQIKRKPYPIIVHQDTFKYVVCLQLNS